MTTLRSCTVALLAGAVTLLSLDAAPVLAQGTGAPGATVANAATFEAALASHERAAERTRRQLSDLLSRDAVKSLAGDRRIDLHRLEERAGTLADEELLRIEGMVTEASAALDLNDTIDLNSTITISVSTVIIILLLLILIT